MIKKNKTLLLITIACTVFYYMFSYYLERTDYIKLITLYALLFTLFYALVQQAKRHFKFLVILAFLFRAIFILAIPNLSQDFYRFIWDGRILLEGINPYLYTVEYFINKGEIPIAQAQELYEGMGMLNASHFTNYPPINQLCFVISGLFANKSILGSVIVLRLIIIAADFGTLFFGKKLLERLNLPTYHIFWYILNPFIIVELTGNLHFEGLMIFFLVWSLYLLHIGKWPFAAMAMALSVSVKLIPLIFLPLFFQFFMKGEILTNKINIHYKKHNIISYGSKNELINRLLKLISFYVIVGITTCMLFAPFFSLEFVSNYSKTIGLWFQKFEFNASVYYILREIGYTIRGYNEIAIIGLITSTLVVVFILYLAFYAKGRTTKELITLMLLGLSCYFFLATTVHPWYIATLLIFSVFTNYKFPLVWSFVIILSYLAYLNINKADKSENLWIIALEYGIVYGVFFWEVFIKKKTRGLLYNTKL